MRIIIGIIVIGSMALLNKDFAELLLASIICTLGAGLIIWLPIAWIIGAAIMPFLAIFFPSTYEKKPTSLTPEQQRNAVLTAYCTDAQSWGLSPEEIKNKLIEAGWTEEQIKPFLMKMEQTNH